MNEILLGFDARIADSRIITKRWNGDQRETYLINPNVAYPVSVDTAVLPSVFKFCADKTKIDAWSIEMTPEDWHQQAFWLWRSLEAMKDAVCKFDDPTRSLSNLWIAITVIESDVIETGVIQIDIRWKEVLDEPVYPSNLNGDWRHIGYDIAERFFISGLSNCGYEENERKVIHPIWYDRINRYGLIDDVDLALEFKEITNLRVLEHAPFPVYGLYVNKACENRLLV